MSLRAGFSCKQHLRGSVASLLQVLKLLHSEILVPQFRLSEADAPAFFHCTCQHPRSAMSYQSPRDEDSVASGEVGQQRSRSAPSLQSRFGLSRPTVTIPGEGDVRGSHPTVEGPIHTSESDRSLLQLQPGRHESGVENNATEIEVGGVATTGDPASIITQITILKREKDRLTQLADLTQSHEKLLQNVTYEKDSKLKSTMPILALDKESLDLTATYSSMRQCAERM